MERLKEIVTKNNTLAGKVFDWTIQLLIVISLITFSIETLPGLTPGSQKMLSIIEMITVLIFTVEYLLRIICADNKLQFIFSAYGLIDLAAFLPFYLTTGIDLRSIRSLRLMRLFVTLKVVRYNKALRKMKHALKDSREELILFFTLTSILIFIAAVGIYYFENPVQPQYFSSIFDGLWWAVATLTTVGYGDIYPITTGGKVFTFIILMLGLGIVAVPAAIFSSALSRAHKLD